KGRVVGADGKPVAEARVFFGQEPYRELNSPYFGQKPVAARDGHFELPLRNFDAPLRVIVLDAKNNQAAVVQFTREQAGGPPVTVRLAPRGSARARFTDAQGKPRADYRPVLWLSLPAEPFARPQGLELLTNRDLHA